jgi:hypothetical protein
VTSPLLPLGRLVPSTRGGRPLAVSGPTAPLASTCLLPRATGCGIEAGMGPTERRPGPRDGAGAPVAGVPTPTSAAKAAYAEMAPDSTSERSR